MKPTIWLLSAALSIIAVRALAQPAAPPAGAPGTGGPVAVRTVQEIRFTGNQRFSTAELAAQLPLKVGDVNTREAVKAAMARIVELYRQAGSDLSLMVDISLPDASHTAVTFLIDEKGTGGDQGAAPRPGRPGGAPPAG